MGAAIEEGLRRLDARKRMVQQNGVSYFRPWVFLITDGAPTDPVANAANLIRAGEARKAFSFYGVGVGSGADFNRLNAICPPERPAAVSYPTADIYDDYFAICSQELSV